MVKQQREHWASRLGFIMAAIGSAIGLGTLWMFPYITGQNGGGLFVLIYLACVVVIGVPVFIAELTLGRRAQQGAVGIFTNLSHKSRNWRLVGWLAVLAPILILSYYQVVAGWGLNYIFLSLSNFTEGRTPAQISHTFDALYSSGDITLLFMFLFTGISVAMVAQGVQKGIEYWARLMTIGLLVVLLLLLAFSVTLPGFGEAFHFLFYPDLAELKPSGILLALGLSLFTLSLGQGVMLTYGSYMRKSDDIPKTALIIAVSDVVISVLAALMVFPIVFSFGFNPDQEAGLIFRTLPVLFARVPGTLIISTLFFVLFVFAALTSAIAMLEVVVATLIELYDWSRKRASLIAGAVILITGIPCGLSGTTALFPQWDKMFGETYFDTINALVGAWILPLVALFTCLFTGWIVPRQQIKEEFQSGTLLKASYPIWRFSVRYFIPLVIILVMLQEGGVINIDRWFGIGSAGGQGG